MVLNITGGLGMGLYLLAKGYKLGHLLQKQIEGQKEPMKSRSKLPIYENG